MVDGTSLFSCKLRAWRARHGTHGRMTQEALADLLGVSVDAIGKYERSVSFIRGDLEHRLVDRLGWSRDETLACREDWESRHRPVRQGGYRLLDDAVLAEVYDGSWHRAARASISMAESELGALTEGLDVDEGIFVPIYETYHDLWAAVMCKDQMVAEWDLLFLLPQDEALFRAGRLIESDLSVDRIRQPILPGTYFGYCPALIVRPGHEAASVLLLSSFVRFLERLAEREIVLHGMGTVSVSPGGAQVCRDLGMTRLTSHCLNPAYGIWELAGSAIPDSIFARRSPLLRRSYIQAFGS
jgi:transcriptional regulator with XRE-family HTH domain